MFLRGIRIEGFKAISSLELRLGWTSVLIGENDSGKTSLADALALCLGVDAEGEEFAFRPDHVHVPDRGLESPGFGSGLGSPGLGSPGLGSTGLGVTGNAARGEIRVVLELGEYESGEWSDERFDLLRPAVDRGPDGRSRMAFEVRARPTPRGADGAMATEWAWLDGRDRPIEELQDPETLLLLRRTMPVVVVRGGLIGGAQRTEAFESPDAQVRADARVVLDLYRQLGQRARPAEDEVRAGFEAARSLALLRGEGRRLPRWLTDDDAPEGAHLRSGLGAERLGLLLVVGAALDAWGAQGPHPLARPIFVIEDPESHLHPMTLASAWDVIEAVRSQKIVTTQSADLLADVPLRSLRRIVRRGDRIETYRLASRTLTDEERRKVRYHVRALRGGALFARCWLLVEGETEFWLLPELARLAGYDLAIEGIACVEFAQCGIAPMAKLANDLGIAWHLIADGDEAGANYARTARAHLDGAAPADRLTTLPHGDMERYLWEEGYADVFARVALGGERSARSTRRLKPGPTIERAIARTSKPHLALAVLEAMAADDSPGVPALLADVVERAVQQAREG